MGKKNFFGIIKDLVVSLLIVVCLIIIISILFYNKVALGKEIPKAEPYELTEEMKNNLEAGELAGEKEEVINYYIKASDLKKYEKANKYVKGKSNPFAEVSNNAIGNNTTTNNNEIANSSNNNNNGNEIDNGNSNGNGGFYEDDGTK